MYVDLVGVTVAEFRLRGQEILDGCLALFGDGVAAVWIFDVMSVLQPELEVGRGLMPCDIAQNFLAGLVEDASAVASLGVGVEKNVPESLLEI